MTNFDEGLHYVYFIRETNSHYVKIGYTNDTQKRLGELQTGTPHTLELMYAIQVEDRETARSIEAALHERFAASIVRGEWYVMGQQDMQDIGLIVRIAHVSASAAAKIWRARLIDLVQRVRASGTKITPSLIMRQVDASND